MNIESKSLQLLKPISSLKKITIFTFIFFIASAILLSVLPWQQTAISEGRVIAYSADERQQNISALVEGRIGKWYVQEGSYVKKDDKIVEIYDNDPNIILNLKSEKQALLLRYEALKKVVEISNLNLIRQKDLYKQGIASKRTYELAEIEYAKSLSEEANIKASLAQIETKISRQYGQTVKAPMAGMILKRMTGEGSTLVKVGDILAVLVPETNSRAAELLVDGNDMPLIYKGQSVRLQFEGWPAIQFSGWPSVAVGTFGGKIAVIDTADNGQGSFRVIILQDPKDPWPDPKYLRQGVRIRAWILLGQVKLGYELWRQFNGFPPSIDKPS